MENYKKTKKALNEVSLVDLSLIDKSTFNPRKKFDEVLSNKDFYNLSKFVLLREQIVMRLFLVSADIVRHLLLD